MEALTGNRGISIDPSQEWYRTLNIDQQISQALQTHQPVVLSTTGNPGNTGLVGNHAYTVIGITGTGSEALVTVRNPWDVDDKVKTVRLGDLVGSGWSGATGDGPVGNVNIGQL